MIFLGFPGGSDVKNLPAMQEMQVQSLGGKIPWRRNGYRLSILAWKIGWAKDPGPWGCKELDMTEQLTLLLFTFTSLPHLPCFFSFSVCGPVVHAFQPAHSL